MHFPSVSVAANAITQAKYNFAPDYSIDVIRYAQRYADVNGRGVAYGIYVEGPNAGVASEGFAYLFGGYSLPERAIKNARIIMITPGSFMYGLEMKAEVICMGFNANWLTYDVFATLLPSESYPYESSTKHRIYYGIKEMQLFRDGDGLLERLNVSEDVDDGIMRSLGYYRFERHKFVDLINGFIEKHDDQLDLSELKMMLEPLSGFEYEIAFRRYIDHRSILLDAFEEFERAARKNVIMDWARRYKII